MFLLSSIFSSNSDILCVLRSFPLPGITLMLCVYGSYTFHLHPLSDIHRHIYLSALLYCSDLLLIPIFKGLPTIASADFSQFVVTTENKSVCEISRDKSVFFLRLPSRFTHMSYGYPFSFTALCQLTLHVGLRIEFLSVELRFRYPFFSPTSHGINLGVALKFVGIYACVHFHHRTRAYSLYTKKDQAKYFHLIFFKTLYISGYHPDNQLIKIYPVSINYLHYSPLPTPSK